MRAGSPVRLAAFLALTIWLTGCTPGAPQPVLPTSTLRSLPTLAVTPLPETMDCIVVSSQPTPEATADSLFPAPQDDDHSLGPNDAPVTFIVYTDFQSPAAAALDAVLRELAERYPQLIRTVQRSFPLPKNTNAMLAAAAVEAAARQDSYWQMSAVIFTRQAEWIALDSSQLQQWLAVQAEELQLDPTQFTQDLRDPQIKTELDQAQRFGLETSIPVIPFVLINGEIYQGPRDIRSLDNLVNLLKMEALQFTECPAFSIDPSRDYLAALETTKGRIVLQLFPREAPLAVNSFVFLARQGWYEGVGFHRVIAGYLAQSGDPSGTGFGSPGYAFPDEISDLRFDRPGLLAMANVGPDSNGSQFFITTSANPDLNGLHTIFGQVVEGMDVLSALTERDPAQAGDLAEPDRILKIEIEEK